MNDELIEKVAEAIWLAEAARANRRRYILWADVGDTMRDNYRPLARAVLSVIRGALSEPTEEMLTAAIYAEGPMRPTVGEALAAKWKAMIAASPIGEK